MSIEVPSMMREGPIRPWLNTSVMGCARFFVVAHRALGGSFLKKLEKCVRGRARCTLVALGIASLVSGGVFRRGKFALISFRCALRWTILTFVGRLRFRLRVIA